MPSFGRWQVAGKSHTCESCKERINPGAVYMRLGFLGAKAFASRAARWPEELKEQDMPAELLNRMFLEAKVRGNPVQTWHESCWRKGDRAESTPTGRSAAVR